MLCKSPNLSAEKRKSPETSISELLFYISLFNYSKIPPKARKNGANTNDTTVINLIRMLIEGPVVSLNGSPTVSPTTAAL